MYGEDDFLEAAYEDRNGYPEDPYPYAEEDPYAGVMYEEGDEDEDR